MVKGPASVFFGQGYPGGVINYVTKRPSFTKIPTELTYQIDDNSGHKVKIDNNTVLSKKAAFRFVGAWQDLQGERRFEYHKNFNLTPTLTLKPLDSGKLTINLEFEYLKERYNWNDYDWIYSDFAGWKAASTSGAYGSSTATLASTIAANAGNGLGANVVQATTTPTLAYATYINNKRTRPATSGCRPTRVLSVVRTTPTPRAPSSMMKASTTPPVAPTTTTRTRSLTATADLSPFEWLDARYTYTNDRAVNNSRSARVARSRPRTPTACTGTSAWATARVTGATRRCTTWTWSSSSTCSASRTRC
ncbi:MAG: hypothetical protein IPN11_03830 [Opitutaceae bacterium]|nr:hypothetical protein [Opitutaceae bacterium]